MSRLAHSPEKAIKNEQTLWILAPEGLFLLSLILLRLRDANRYFANDWLTMLAFV